MLSKAPRHAVQILWREDGPDEEMRPQHRTRCHNKRDTRGDKEGQNGEVLPKNEAVALAVLAQQQEIGGGDPEDRASPVADKGEEADGDDVEAADSIVGT